MSKKVFALLVVAGLFGLAAVHSAAKKGAGGPKFPKHVVNLAGKTHSFLVLDWDKGFNALKVKDKKATFKSGATNVEFEADVRKTGSTDKKVILKLTSKRARDAKPVKIDVTGEVSVTLIDGGTDYPITVTDVLADDSPCP